MEVYLYLGKVVNLLIMMKAITAPSFLFNIHHLH